MRLQASLCEMLRDSFPGNVIEGAESESSEQNWMLQDKIRNQN